MICQGYSGAFRMAQAVASTQHRLVASVRTAADSNPNWDIIFPLMCNSLFNVNWVPGFCGCSRLL